MKHFWHAFEKTASPVQFKRHVILLYWKPEEDGPGVRDSIKKLSARHPSVKVKVINVEKDPTKPGRHQVYRFPAVLLLKDGREVDRLEGSPSPLFLEELFRRAQT